MGIDEHGVPERPIDLYLFERKQDGVSGQADGNKNQIWITDELKTAGQAFLNSWHTSHTEALADLNIDSLRLKFKDAETKNNFLQALKTFVELHKEHLSTGVPLTEQQEIVRRVAGLFALADQLEQRLAQARKQVVKLTPALLARAFAGQLVPQNPVDEPAERLLERLRQSGICAD